MKKLLVSKTSGLLAFLLTFSCLLPVMAFAAGGIKTPTNNDQTASSSVYLSSNVYTLLGGQESIEVELWDRNGRVYDGNGNPAVVTATYNRAKTAVGFTYFDFTVPKSTYSAYSALYFKYTDPSTDLHVSDWVYRTSAPSVPGDGSGGYFPPTNPASTITPGADGVVNAGALASALANGGTATIQITGNTAVLPASALTSGESVTVVTDEGVSYTLPLDALDIDALAKSLGIAVGNLNIQISIEQLTGSAASAATTAVNAEVDGTIIAPVVDFTVTAVGGGKEQEINDFPVYVAKSFKLSTPVADPNTVTVVTYTPGEGVSVVPTSSDGTVAVAHNKHNSIYTVVQVDKKSFRDLTNHWAKEDVETLATKLIVEGTRTNVFEPKRNITRAEFAALVVRALGLDATGTTSKFSDVSASGWYAGAVAAAADAGIINGYTNGTFKPTASISRQELAAMVVRAQKYAGKEVTLTDAQVSSALAAFTDAGTLAWAKGEVAVAVSSGLIKGQTNTKIVALANTNRAEAATILKFLSVRCPLDGP
jgi:N-acetylmuramoyl-L-alanine amidase